MSKALWVNAPYRLCFKEVESRVVAPDEIKIKTLFSGISHGTELNLYTGNSPFKEKRFDLDRRIFIKDDSAKFYPIQLGYELVGRVVEVGCEMKHFNIGDLVHGFLPHQEVIYAKDVGYGLLKLPSDFKPEVAMFIALGCVALNAIHDAEIKFGDEVGIFGLGVIGLLALQFARLNGAGRIYVSDPVLKRRKLARTFGADEVLDPINENVPLKIKELSKHKGLDIAIESAGKYPALNDAIKSVRMSGSVVTTGYYSGDTNALVLSEEWHHNRLTMKSSIGAWNNYHRSYPLWNYSRLKQTVLEALVNGNIKTDDMISHVIPFEEAEKGYDLIEKHPEETIKVIFSYQ